MRIGELARRLATDPPTIRYYEEVGLRPPPKRGANRYRQYGGDDRCATGTRQLLAVIERRSEQVERQIVELRGPAVRFAALRRQLANEESTTMAVENPVDPAGRPEQETPTAICDCGCAGSGCSCGCGCCGGEEHVDHLTAVEILARPADDACDCGCCG